MAPDISYKYWRRSGQYYVMAGSNSSLDLLIHIPVTCMQSIATTFVGIFPLWIPLIDWLIMISSSALLI